jgi:heme/copper-type cytochrome/quinol oxidase subunit 4
LTVIVLLEPSKTTPAPPIIKYLAVVEFVIFAPSFTVIPALIVIGEVYESKSACVNVVLLEIVLIFIQYLNINKIKKIIKDSIR